MRLHRNVAVFPRPEIYDPDRFLPKVAEEREPYTYIPYGGGPRNCIGEDQILGGVCFISRKFGKT